MGGCGTPAADYDLTGQIMWPAAQLLADYLAANPSVMTGCRCALELGSGLGLPGLLCAKVRHCPYLWYQQNLGLSTCGVKVCLSV